MKGCLEIRIQINKKIINFPMHYYYLEHEYSLSFVKGYSISLVLVSCNFFFLMTLLENACKNILDISNV